MKQPKIALETLVCMDEFETTHPITVYQAYKFDKAPNIFGQIYSETARLWLHQDLADIVLNASKICYERSGYSFILYDGLRTVEAQKAMMYSPITRANPHWLEQPNRLLSPPGKGAHPRGMAIDVSLIDSAGALLDMGTVFDYLAENPDVRNNPAHRSYVDLKPEHAKNRETLNSAMIEAAEALGHALHLLDAEWWDFRFPAEIYNQFDPLSDQDLPKHMRQT